MAQSLRRVKTGAGLLSTELPFLANDAVSVWVNRISSQWHEAIECFLATGRMLIEAEENLGGANYSKLLGRNDYPQRLPFSHQTAYWLVAIAKSERVVNLSLHLPPSIKTLYAIAKLSDEDFDSALQEIISPDLELSELKAWLRQRKIRDDEARVRNIKPIRGKFRTIVIDPPWDHEGFSLAGRGAPLYAVMTQEELLAMKIAERAEDNCHLYLWTTNNFLLRAGELIEPWGFSYKTVITWTKPRFGLGSYFRSSTEHCLFAVRGELSTRVADIPTHFGAPLGEHSEKPDKFYKEIVERASYPPYLEIFQRKPRPNWASWDASAGMVDAA